MKQILLLVFMLISLSTFGQSKAINIECWEGEYKDNYCANCPNNYKWGQGIRVFQSGIETFLYAPISMESDNNQFTLTDKDGKEFTGMLGLTGYTRAALQVVLSTCNGINSGEESHDPVTLGTVPPSFILTGQVIDFALLASEINVSDAGNFIAATNVEDALQEIQSNVVSNDNDIALLQGQTHNPVSIGTAPDGFTIDPLQNLNVDIDAEDIDISIAIPNLLSGDVQAALTEHQTDIDALSDSIMVHRSLLDQIINQAPTIYHREPITFAGGETSYTIMGDTPTDINTITFSCRGVIYYLGTHFTITGNTINFLFPMFDGSAELKYINH